MTKIFLLRVFHGIVSLYFIACLLYLYRTAVTADFDVLFWAAFVSLGLEGIAIFLLNGGDCPLIHIQQKIGDDKPFFALFLPAKVAKRAIPFFAMLAWIAVALLLLRWLTNVI